jgi:choline-sulfatase
MTGRYASSIGVYDNGSPFATDEPTVAHRLAVRGYETVMAGKMHFVGPDQFHGFERRLTGDIFTAGFGMLHGRDGKVHDHARAYATAGVAETTRDMAFDEDVHARSLAYLGQRTDERPLFMLVSYQLPHQPLLVPQAWWDAMEGVDIPLPDLPENLESLYTPMDCWLNYFHGVQNHPVRDPEVIGGARRAYCAMVAAVDRRLGELLDAVDLDRTAVIFTSDHGDMLGELGMVQKRSFRQWSSRIPLVVALPGGAHAGERCDRAVSLLDVASTVLGLAGAEDSPDSDGASLLDALEERAESGRTVFGEQHVEGVRAQCYMAVKGNRKYVCVEGHSEHLYDLSTDLNELRDLASEPSHEAALVEMRRSVHTRFNAEKIEAELQRHLSNRMLLKRAMGETGTRWDYRVRE